ncbi:MAG: hypothetical protein RL758_266 [Pseudomonadota bacterium]
MISDYTGLQSAIADWMHRADLSARIPEFIALAETRLNGDLESRELEVTSQATLSAGVSTLAVPPDLVELRRLRVLTDPVRVLVYSTPDQITAEYAYAAPGAPRTFTVLGGSFEFAPVPDSNYAVELIYRQRITPLSAGAPTNVILTNYPDAYLYGTLAAAHPYTQDDERQPLFESLYSKAVDAINSIDWWSGSSLRVRNL